MKHKSVHPPKHLQGILWSHDIHGLNIEENKIYIIHQILAYGSINEWMWLFDTYSHREVKKIFVSTPYKDYRSARFNFVKNYLLDIEDHQLNPTRYVKNTPRDIRQTAY